MKLLYQPSASIIKNSNLMHFKNWLFQEKQLQFNDYQELWEWSINHVNLFWTYLMTYFDIHYDGDVNPSIRGDKMPFFEWFPNIKLSYSEHIFKDKNLNETALIFQNEFSERQAISWQELKSKTYLFQQFLIRKGIRKGDRIVAYMPNIPEAIIAFLAVNSIGAIWSSCSQDFGSEGVVERFKLLEPKLMIATNGYSYNGKFYDKQADIQSIISKIPSLKTTVLIDYIPPVKPNISEFMSWDKIMADKNEGELLFEKVEFNHPLWILFSSGTTGKPKAIVHSTGGNLIEHYKYLSFHNNLKIGERFFWWTTTGWMMWNFSVSSLLLHNTLVIFDGNPMFQKPDFLWQFAKETKINHFGTSAPYILACMKQIPKLEFELPNLLSISSTGSPLPAEGFQWIYQTIKKDIFVWSMSGGTDICSAFVGGNAMEPIYEGEIQCRTLGAGVFAYNESQQPVINQVGEMVITKPMPSMPIYFWNDENKSKYIDSYFSEYQTVWRHGDWIKITLNNGVIIYGRSDATLNRNGIRIGTAEIYNILNQIPEIEDSIIVNIEKPDGSHWMPLFIKTKHFSEKLKLQINHDLKEKCSPRHIPDDIFEVPDIPYTINGKKMETIVKKMLMKMEISHTLNTESMKNPESLEFFMKFNLQ